MACFLDTAECGELHPGGNGASTLLQKSSGMKAFYLAVVATSFLANGAAAQSVSLTGGFVTIKNAVGPTVTADHFGTINVGGNGSGGNLILRDTDASQRISLIGGSADMVLGGGNDDGDIVLRDTDGVTTTVSLDGEFGFIQLGSVDEDGDLRLWDNDPDNEFSIDLDGGTGNVTNQLNGNGLVKAWAKINADGSVNSCWRCVPGETAKIVDGSYAVSFSALGADVRSRPRLAILDSHSATSISTGQISVKHLTGNDHKIHVLTENSSGDLAARGFTLLVF